MRLGLLHAAQPSRQFRRGVLASQRDRRCHASVETVCQALIGNYREEHIFALTQAVELYDVYQTKVLTCDTQIEAILKRLKQNARPPKSKLPPARRRARQSNEPAFDVREALHAILGVDLTQINGLGPSLALKLVGECGTNLTAWPSAKHFTSWLGLAPHNKISGGKVLSSKTRRTRNRAASLLRLVASGWANQYCAGCFLPPAIGAGGEGESDHRHRPQDRGSVLQHPSSRHVLCRSRRELL
jgi:transposase